MRDLNVFYVLYDCTFKCNFELDRTELLIKTEVCLVEEK